ncbi:MAG: PAS domain S-box protein [Spirochaetaceae bacterium]|nr:PAS domain S-box protein [Spirochaetaceae bacterium]
MKNNHKLSAEVLGQIAIMQSVIPSLPNKTSMLNFACQGLKDIPGIEKITFQLFEREGKLIQNRINKNHLYKSFPIKANGCESAVLTFLIRKEKDFVPYIPYIDNFCNVLALVIEEKKQRMVNENLIQKMEDLVKQRTIELEIAKERLSIALNGANSGIWDWNLKTGVIYFDRNYYTISGYDPYEFPGKYKEWKKRVHPDDIEKAEKSIKDYLDGVSEQYIDEFRFLRKSGEWMWILGQGKIFEYDSDGNPLRFSGAHTDITIRKSAEENLKKAQNYIVSILDSMPSVLISVNSKGIIQQLNKKAEEMINHKSSELIGKNLNEIIPQYYNEISQLETAIDSGEKINRRRKQIIINEDIHYKDIIVFPITTKGEKGAVLRIDDVTEQVKMEEVLIQNEKMLSLGGLAAGMAHEINNPLAGMIQTAQVLASRLGAKAYNKANLEAAEKAETNMDSILKFLEYRDIPKMLSAIHESGLRVSHIVENMLSFSRKSNQKSHFYHIPDILDSTIELVSSDYDLKKDYDFKKIQIIKKYEKDLPQILCEKSKIQQVFLNLLRNGAAAMEGRENPLFVISVSNDHNRKNLRLTIEDNGSGMDEEVRKRIFEPFFTTKPIGIGTGLGLSISYFIIAENHSGTMSVKSVKGQGSTFIITLPY